MSVLPASAENIEKFADMISSGEAVAFPGNRDQMNRLPKFMWLTGPDVCRKSYESVMENKGPIVVNGLFYKILGTAVKILPSNLATKLLSLHNRNAKPLPRDIRDPASQTDKAL